MQILRGTTDSLVLVTGASGDIRPTLDLMQVDASTPPVVQVIPNSQALAAITGTTSTTLATSSGLASGAAYNVKGLKLYNAHATVSVPCTLQIADGTNTSVIWNGTLAPSEEMVLDEQGNITVLVAGGRPSFGFPLTTFGDLLGFGTSPVRIPAGADGTVQFYAAAATAGMRPSKPVATNNSLTTVSAGFAADTYLAGSSINMPSAGPVAGVIYECEFDMTKTAAGTAAFTVNVRYGTAGSTADASLASFAFAAGTAAVDKGWFKLTVIVRTVGSGTAAVVAGVLTCNHALAATGLISTGAAGHGQVDAVSSGFNSTPSGSVLGISVNGGASFSGTCTVVKAEAKNVF